MARCGTTTALGRPGGARGGDQVRARPGAVDGYVGERVPTVPRFAHVEDRQIRGRPGTRLVVTDQDGRRAGASPMTKARRLAGLRRVDGQVGHAAAEHRQCGDHERGGPLQAQRHGASGGQPEGGDPGGQTTAFRVQLPVGQGVFALDQGDRVRPGRTRAARRRRSPTARAPGRAPPGRARPGPPGPRHRPGPRGGPGVRGCPAAARAPSPPSGRCCGRRTRGTGHARNPADRCIPPRRALTDSSRSVLPSRGTEDHQDGDAGQAQRLVGGRLVERHDGGEDPERARSTAALRTVAQAFSSEPPWWARHSRTESCTRPR
ncbi:hypothetical protein SBADM41S_06100 [Streptomyces badius]